MKVEVGVRTSFELDRREILRNGRGFIPYSSSELL